MKTRQIKTIVLFLFTILIFSCNKEDLESQHSHANLPNKNEISFKQFKAETGITKFDYIKTANINRSTDLMARNIEAEFITDTIGIKKYVNPVDSKTTYSFKIYPVSEDLNSKEYYNLVYEKIGAEWNEIIFFNTEKDNPTDGRVLESSEMVYNRMSAREGYTTVITYSVQCNGSCKDRPCDGFGCSTRECIKTTITYVFTGIADTSIGLSGSLGNSGSPSNPGGGTDGGVYIPNPYNGDVALNNADFMLAGQVSAYTNTLPADLQALITTHNFVFPWLVDFFKKNNGVTDFNKILATTALNHFKAFQGAPSITHVTNANKEKVNFWALYTFLNYNSFNENTAKVNEIKNFLIATDSETANTIVDYLYENREDEESVDFVNELTNLASLETNQEDAESAIKLSLAFDSSDDIFSESFEQSIAPLTNIGSLGLPPDYPLGMLSVTTFVNYKKLRQVNPEWSRAKCLYYATKEIIHVGLDAFGLIPVLGEIADITNGVLYVIEGDNLNATLSFGSAVPIAGWATVSVKYSLKVVNIASDVTTKVKLVWKVLPNGSIYFGSNSHCRATLRKVLGLAVGNANKAHHIIPLNLQTNTVVQRAAKSGSAFHMNEALNGIPLTSAVHNGSHGAYDGKIAQKLNDFITLNPNATPDQCYVKVNQIIQQIRTAIQNNPGTPINQLNF